MLNGKERKLEGKHTAGLVPPPWLAKPTSRASFCQRTVYDEPTNMRFQGIVSVTGEPFSVRTESSNGGSSRTKDNLLERTLRRDPGGGDE